MGEEDLQTDEDQHRPTKNACLALQTVAEAVADGNGCQAEKKGNYPDHRDGKKDVRFEEGEGDTNCQRIDAGGNGEKEQLLQIEPSYGFDGTGGVLGQRVVEHFRSNDGKEDECDPMVDGGDVPLKLNTEQPAQERHSSLEKAEEEGDDEGLSVVDLPHSQSLAQRDSKGIHGKSYRDQE